MLNACFAYVSTDFSNIAIDFWIYIEMPQKTFKIFDFFFIFLFSSNKHQFIWRNTIIFQLQIFEMTIVQVVYPYGTTVHLSRWKNFHVWLFAYEESSNKAKIIFLCQRLHNKIKTKRIRKKEILFEKCLDSLDFSPIFFVFWISRKVCFLYQSASSFRLIFKNCITSIDDAGK